MFNSQENVSPSTTKPEIERLGKKYEFRDKAEVTNFILANPQLESLFFEALEPITTVFPGSALSLEVFHNQEYQDADQLVISISTELEVKDALAELDKIDRGWWGNNINRAKGKLIIEFVSISAPKRKKKRPTEADRQAFLASVGGWKDVDSVKLLEDIYESRRAGNRPPIDL